LIPDNSLVIGSPGKVVRILTETEIAAMHANTAHYVKPVARYADGLHPVVK
jgi:carbonic anhydrase/acetyltransferase-like protein (isoleucine patch superfamily)